MKSYYKGILVGISIVISSLLLMGYKSSETEGEVGRYQIIQVDYSTYIYDTGNDRDKSSIMKIDTKTGEVYLFNHYLKTNSNTNKTEFGHFWFDVTESKFVD